MLCKKAILVEGDSDELVVQRAYLDKYGKPPIEDNIDIISARNLSFLRYLKIAKQLMIPVCVVTDNDGDDVVKAADTAADTMTATVLSSRQHFPKL